MKSVKATSLRDEILNHLRRLRPSLQKQVLHYASSLAHGRLRGTPGSEMMELSGILPTREARAISEAIEADCERIDPNGWRESMAS